MKVKKSVPHPRAPAARARLGCRGSAGGGRLAGMTQPLLQVTSDFDGVDPTALRAVRAQGAQRIGAPYEYTIDVEVSVEGGLTADQIDGLLTERCHLSLGEELSEIHGVLRRVEMLPMSSSQPAVYRWALVPRLWRASLCRGSRIFQDMSWADIASSVLTEHGIPHELQLTRSYPVREYTVQYEEDDLSFLSRLLEHWGIFYFFEQQPDGEKMIVADDNRAFVTIPEHEVLAYAAGTGDGLLRDRATVTELHRACEVRTASIALRDYNWRHPSVVPEGSAPCDTASGYGASHAYGDHVKDPEEAALLARIRAEEQLATREVYRARTTLPQRAPGCAFQLDGHPSGELDAEYVVTEIAERLDDVDGGRVLEKTFVAIPRRVVYRPARVTTKPRVHGTMHAIVDGEIDGTAAPIDELGRYKLLFPFDRNGEAGGRASRWVRMAQVSSGASYGVHFPLHIGCEVAVLHLGGDPDRPIIVGAVPNAETISPITRADATKSRIRTRSGILVELEDDGPS